MTVPRSTPQGLERWNGGAMDSLNSRVKESSIWTLTLRASAAADAPLPPAQFADSGRNRPDRPLRWP